VRLVAGPHAKFIDLANEFLPLASVCAPRRLALAPCSAAR
jgi:hypothetical protein